MAFQPAVCATCGGHIKVDDVDLNGFCECEYCHTPHKVIDIITVDGLPTVKSLLTNADVLMADGNADKAVETYKEVIRIKPNCHEAWWGLYLCHRFYDRYYGYKDKYGNSGPLTKAAMMENTLQKYALRAIEYAPEAVRPAYREEIEPEETFIRQARQGQYDRQTAGKTGCYVATAVYGDPACPPVMALRRYRDDYLARRAWGRTFIRAYYAVSPWLARHIRPQSRLGRAVRRFLDKKVERLERAACR